MSRPKLAGFRLRCHLQVSTTQEVIVNNSVMITSRFTNATIFESHDTVCALVKPNGIFNLQFGCLQMPNLLIDFFVWPWTSDGEILQLGCTYEEIVQPSERRFQPVNRLESSPH